MLLQPLIEGDGIGSDGNANQRVLIDSGAWARTVDHAVDFDPVEVQLHLASRLVIGRDREVPLTGGQYRVIRLQLGGRTTRL